MLEIRVFRDQRMYEKNLRTYVYIVEPPFDNMCSGVSDNICEIIGKIRMLKRFGYRLHIPRENSNTKEEYRLHRLDEGKLIRELEL